MANRFNGLGFSSSLNLDSNRNIALQGVQQKWNQKCKHVSERGFAHELAGRHDANCGTNDGPAA